MEDKSLNPKIKKNLYDLKHDKLLQNSNNWINGCLAIWLVIIGGIITWVCERQIDFSKAIFVGSLFTSIILSIGLFSYRSTNKKRKSIIDKIINLNPYSKDI